MPTNSFVLWGTPHSLFTGKVRSYLLKHGIPFVERTPADPRFAAAIVPAIGLQVVPVLETGDGELWQDSTDIIDRLEQRSPRLTASGKGLRGALAHLLDAFGCNALLPMAMHYRWTYRAQQEQFLIAEFGRAIPSNGLSAPQKAVFTAKIMDKFAGFLGGLGVTPEVRPIIEQDYLDLLAALEVHFQNEPYALGRAPSMADFGLMAPLYAHLARDPVPGFIMKTKAPAVARWTERMNTCGLADPEFPDADTSGTAALPATLDGILEVAFRIWSPGLLADAAQFNAWCRSLADPAPGTLVSSEAQRHVHARLGRIEYTREGCTFRRESQPQSLWHLARAQAAAAALGAEEAAEWHALLARTGGLEALQIGLERPIVRHNNVLVLG
ncbi:glutathione S-transferase family protein [Novosphingobium sp.]|uniref:glutathione S-transferase family protein n=1 Tax=Novosphingobium sp. TaxID=1874826 RepID=UPI001D276EAD|nr:glutathione S-transferase family protein [Novosphingobium sp.]MBX9664823.1 glutathione S-transferase family protein [Novosphingobium sp.]